VFIKTCSGRVSTLVINSFDSIDFVKLMIQDKEGIPAEHQRLIFAGKQLSNDYSLADCRIWQDSVLYVCMTLKGGSLLTPSSTEERKAVSLMMQKPEGETVFMNTFGDSASKVIVQQFLSLQNGSELVDTIVNSWVMMIEMMAMSSNTKKIKLMNSFFFSKLQLQVCG
jgi:large subunit ribosomal protein L40e